MSEPIRFHLDENVDPAIALGLRRYGVDVTTTNDVELRTQSDEMRLAFIDDEWKCDRHLVGCVSASVTHHLMIIFL